MDNAAGSFAGSSFLTSNSAALASFYQHAASELLDDRSALRKEIAKVTPALLTILSSNDQIAKSPVGVILASFLTRVGGSQRKAASTTGLVKCGWLSKPSGRGFGVGMDKRWCVLDGTTLSYYADRAETDLRGVIQLRGATVVPAAKRLFSDSGTYAFEIHAASSSNKNNKGASRKVQKAPGAANSASTGPLLLPPTDNEEENERPEEADRDNDEDSDDGADSLTSPTTAAAPAGEPASSSAAAAASVLVSMALNPLNAKKKLYRFWAESTQEREVWMASLQKAVSFAQHEAEAASWGFRFENAPSLGHYLEALLAFVVAQQQKDREGSSSVSGAVIAPFTLATVVRVSADWCRVHMAAAKRALLQQPFPSPHAILSKQSSSLMFGGGSSGHHSNNNAVPSAPLVTLPVDSAFSENSTAGHTLGALTTGSAAGPHGSHHHQLSSSSSAAASRRKVSAAASASSKNIGGGGGDASLLPVVSEESSAGASLALSVASPANVKLARILEKRKVDADTMASKVSALPPPPPSTQALQGPGGAGMLMPMAPSSLGLLMHSAEDEDAAAAALQRGGAIKRSASSSSKRGNDDAFEGLLPAPMSPGDATADGGGGAAVSPSEPLLFNSSSTLSSPPSFRVSAKGASASPPGDTGSSSAAAGGAVAVAAALSPAERKRAEMQDKAIRMAQLRDETHVAVATAEVSSHRRRAGYTIGDRVSIRQLSRDTQRDVIVLDGHAMVNWEVQALTTILMVRLVEVANDCFKLWWGASGKGLTASSPASSTSPPSYTLLCSPREAAGACCNGRLAAFEAQLLEFCREVLLCSSRTVVGGDSFDGIEAVMGSRSKQVLFRPDTEGPTDPIDLRVKVLGKSVIRAGSADDACAPGKWAERIPGVSAAAGSTNNSTEPAASSSVLSSYRRDIRDAVMEHFSNVVGGQAAAPTTAADMLPLLSIKVGTRMRYRMLAGDIDIDDEDLELYRDRIRQLSGAGNAAAALAGGNGSGSGAGPYVPFATSYSPDLCLVEASFSRTFPWASAAPSASIGIRVIGFAGKKSKPGSLSDMATPVKAGAATGPDGGGQTYEPPSYLLSASSVPADSVTLLNATPAPAQAGSRSSGNANGGSNHTGNNDASSFSSSQVSSVIVPFPSLAINESFSPSHASTASNTCTTEAALSQRSQVNETLPGTADAAAAAATKDW